ncbi:trans-aconitate 2-methyltransferase [Methylobacterium oryzisoli]|uniref:trans-aconitate 2-methyltransferase n=1 Tax=Methylobacterium oryzisoli TaxID=3385502 RepID=UPI00389213B0
MAGWDAAQYLKFAEERTRPAADLLARIPLSAPGRVIDLGCGPGNSTELLAARFPEAHLTGVDSSPDMLAEARRRLPGHPFVQADVAQFAPEAAADLLFANAVLQWLPDHATLLPRLARHLAPGGCLAVQMPDNLDEPSHRLMRAVAAEAPFAEALAAAAASRTRLGSFHDYDAWLTAAGCTVEIWRTTYVHPLAGHRGIVEWVKGTGLRPFLAPLDPDAQAAFLARYEEALAEAYPPQPDGRVLLPFPRLFVVARRVR